MLVDVVVSPGMTFRIGTTEYAAGETCKVYPQDAFMGKEHGIFVP